MSIFSFCHNVCLYMYYYSLLFLFFRELRHDEGVTDVVWTLYTMWAGFIDSLCTADSCRLVLTTYFDTKLKKNKKKHIWKRRNCSFWVISTLTAIFLKSWWLSVSGKELTCYLIQEILQQMILKTSDLNYGKVL